jgi:hypothetical protein
MKTIHESSNVLSVPRTTKASLDVSTINPSRRAIVRGAAMLAAAPASVASLAFPIQAGAADYPTHPIRMIHAFSSGSATDSCGRIIAEGLTQRLGQSVIVENRPGVNGEPMMESDFVKPEQLIELKAILQSNGYAPHDIDGIFGANWLRVCEHCWGTKA